VSSRKTSSPRSELSSPFMGRWPEGPKGLSSEKLSSPRSVEVAAKPPEGLSWGKLSSPFMGRWPEGPEGLSAGKLSSPRSGEVAAKPPEGLSG
jgi:hypothetical protein